MKKSKLYKVHDSIHELSQPIQKLLKKANRQLKNAYAPYSKFNVGAAILLDNGKIIGGSNQENASYPLCICAERVALNTHGASGSKKKIIALAITAQNKEKPLSEPCMPCGACRQVIQEYEYRQGSPIDIYVTADGLLYTYQIKGIEKILPNAFDKESLI